MKPTDEELKANKKSATEWAKERLSDPRTVVVDCETTGILRQDPETEIVQLSITDTKARPLFSMLLKPAQPMSDEVIGIHGITNEQVVNQPIFSQVAKMISFVMEGKHVVAYNADFDVALLVHLFKKYSIPVPKFNASCCMDQYAQWKGEWNDKKDGYRWQKLPQLSGMPSHDAFSDCVSTLKVMEMMAGDFDPAAVEADSIDLDF